MPSFDTGLQHRVKRLVQQIADQHRHLMALRGEIDAALERGVLRDVGNAFKSFETALAAHFDLEQRSFFPALHGLARSRSAELEALEREHEGFLAALRALAADADRVDAGATRGALARQLAALRDHELREERLVAQIAQRE